MKPSPMYLSVSRASLIIAILASVAVGGTNLIKLRERIVALHAEIKTQRTAREQTERQLAQTKTVLAEVLSALKATKTALEISNSERDHALTEASAAARRSEELDRLLKKTKTERNEAQNELAHYKNTSLTPEQVSTTSQIIRRLETSAAAVEIENSILMRKIKLLMKSEPDTFPEKPVPLPANLISKITVTDPKWHFVVLDAGWEKGMLERGELLLSRAGKLLGKVKVSRVEKDRSFANVSLGWDLAEAKEGDIAIPANPESL